MFNSSLHTKHFKNPAQKCLLKTEVKNPNYLQDSTAQHKALQCCRTAYIILIFRPQTQKYLDVTHLSENCQEQDQACELLFSKCSLEATCSFLKYNRAGKRNLLVFFVENVNDLVKVYLLLRDLA